MHSHMSFIPSQQVGVIVLNNEGSVSSPLTKHISHIAHGILLDKPIPHSQIQNMRERTVENYHKNKVMLSQMESELSQRPWQLTLNKEAYM